jgi:hypothetical protein
MPALPIPLLDSNPITPSITSGPDVTRISRITGKTTSSFTFRSDRIYNAYQLRIVPSGSSPQTAGELLEAGSGGPANTDRSVDVTDAELDR